MFFLIYVSSAVKPFTQSELAELLRTCHQNNSARGISGMLLYKDGNFMQLLEGEEEAVRRLYEKIAGDPRHRGELVLLQGAQAERQFPAWSMGFRDVSAAGAAGSPGYNEFFNTEFTGEEFSAHPTRAQKLLLSFKKKM